MAHICNYIVVKTQNGATKNMNEYFEEKLWAEVDSGFRGLTRVLRANVKKLSDLQEK